MRKSVQTCPPEDCCPPDAVTKSPTSGHKAEEELAEFCKAIGHPARVRILNALLEKNVCIAGELADEVPLAASTVSQHLKILKDAGLIKGEVDGPRRCYCADRSAVSRLQALVAALDHRERASTRLLAASAATRAAAKTVRRKRHAL